MVDSKKALVFFLLLGLWAGAATRAATPPSYVGLLAPPSLPEMFPSGLEYDDNLARIVIADTGLDRILVYGPGGHLLFEFGTFGPGPGEFDTPRDIAIDGDSNIYVADSGNNRIQKFDKDGNYQWDIPGFTIGLTWDNANSVLLVALTGQNMILALDSDGTEAWLSPPGTTLGIRAPRDVIRGPDGRVWVADYKNHQIKAFDVSDDGQWSTSPVLVLGDGTAGDQENQLNFPYNVDFSPDGTVAYVASTGAGHIARWNITDPLTPIWLAPFGELCSRDSRCPDPPADIGLLSYLRRVVVTGTGDLITADFWGSGLQVWTPSGDVSLQIGGADAPLPGFAEAFGVGVGGDGTGYVVDRLNHRIQRFDYEGRFISASGYRGTRMGALTWPEGVTVGPDGKVWIADTRNDRIQVWTADLLTVEGVIGKTGDALGEFRRPSAVSVALDGTAWIADTKNDRVQAYVPSTGAFSILGERGTLAGEFLGPQGIHASHEAIYVADTGNNRVQVFDVSGAYQGSTQPGALVGPQGVVEAADGTVWVADSGNHRVVQFSADLGQQLAVFGRRGAGPSEFYSPHALASYGRYLYVADTYNHRVQLFEFADEAKPTLGVLQPAQDEFVNRLPALFRGTAEDDRGVAEVLLSIKDRQTGLWYRSDGTWGAWEAVPAMLHDAGARTTAWSFRWEPPAGGSGAYGMSVRALDAAGNLAKSDWTRFALVAAGTTPEILANTPVFAETLLSSPVPFWGSARDDVGVSGVKVAIRDRVTGFWYQGDGSWGPGWDALDAQIASPGATETEWSLDWVPVTGGSGSYGASIRVFDDERNVGVHDWLPFEVEAPLYDRELSNPGGVAPLYPAGGTFDSAGNLYVADSGGSRIVRIDGDGNQAEFLSEGLLDPRDIELDSSGNTLWIADTQNHCMVNVSLAGEVLASFGGRGMFKSPYGISNDATGVYLADTYNHAIRKLAKSDGAEIWQQHNCFGEPFSRPRSIQAGDGVLYVGDSDNRRVLTLDPASGACLTQITGVGAVRALEVTRDGSLWIADASKTRIRRYISGSEVSAVGAYGTRNGEYRSPHCLFARDSDLYVCDTYNWRIQQYSFSDIDPVPMWAGIFTGVKAASEGFNRPFGTAYFDDGRLLVVDWFNHLVKLFDDQDQFLFERGGYGTSGGEPMLFPRAVAVSPDGAEFVLTDSERRRLAVFDDQGNFLRTVRPNTGQRLYKPYQTAVAADGSYWVADARNDRVVHLSTTGDVLGEITDGTSLDEPRGVALDASGNIYVSVHNSDSVRQYKPDGTFVRDVLGGTNGAVGLKNPHHVVIGMRGSDEWLFVADSGNDRIVMVELSTGRWLTIGGTGTGPGLFDRPLGVAFHPATREISVADHRNNRISVWHFGQ